MRIIGIDPGTRLCGYGVIDVIAGETAYVECGVLVGTTGASMESRLAEIALGLQEVCMELKPGVVAVEDTFAHVNVRSALALAQGRGVALAIAGLLRLQAASYPPAVVKKSIAGGGRAPKEQVAAMVARLLKMKNAPTADAADALAIALTHARLQASGGTRMMSAVIRPLEMPSTKKASSQ